MTGRIEKTVFISYRRTNFWTALAVFQNLHANGYDVFFDYKSIPSGDFEQVITENVKSRAHFIVILSPSALERCNEPGDWLRREIETAIENKRNIIPLMMEGFEFGSSSTVKALIEKLADLKKYNAISIPVEYFDDAMIKLRSDRFLNKPLESVSHPVSEITKQITEEQKSAANEAPPVEPEQLTAQEWDERGYKYYESGNLDESIRCHSESIRLDPKNAFAYYSRGYMLHLTGELDRAIEDYNQAIQLESESDDLASYHAFRGNSYFDKGDIDSTIADFNKAIQLNPKDAFINFSRGDAYHEKGDLDAALADYNESIRLDSDEPSAYYNRALVWEAKKDYAASITDYQKYLEHGGGERDGDQKDVEDKIKKLKSKLTK